MVEFVRPGKTIIGHRKLGLRPTSPAMLQAQIQFTNATEVVSARIASTQGMGRLGIGLMVELPFSVMLVSAQLEARTRVPLVVPLTARTGVLQEGDMVNVSLTYFGKKVEGRIPALLEIKLADQ